MAQKGKQRSKAQPRSSSTKCKKNEVQDSKLSVTEEKDAVQHMSEHQQRQCIVLLRKLMRHKFGWVFNEPVDAEKLELHDYHSIIKYPMDLGTVKERLMSNFYASPLDFATDVRLTFSNALLYNPKTDDVHAMALTLSALFEDSWQELAQKFAIQGRDAAAAVMNCDLQSRDNKVASISDVANLDAGKVATQSRAVKRLRISFGSNLQRSQQPVRELTVAEKVWLVDTLENAPDDVQVDVTQIIQEHHPVVDGDEVDVRNLDKATLWRIYKVVRDRHVASSSTSSAHELIASENAASEARLEDATHDSSSETHRDLVEKTRNVSASLRDTGSGSSSPPSESKPRSRSSSPSDSNSASSSEGSDSDSSSTSEESSSSSKYEADEEVE